MPLSSSQRVQKSALSDLFRLEGSQHVFIDRALCQDVIDYDRILLHKQSPY